MESKQLYNDELITQEQFQSIADFEKNKPLSVFWELRTILFLGILMLTSGISILIYLNIDSIGHQAILAFIILCSFACFYYCFKNRIDYNNQQVKYASPLFDYIILLGCSLFGIFIGYIQFQYQLFGYHYGIAILIPTIIFFSCAYLFDHKGILSLGISGLAAWAGLSITPLEMLKENDFSDSQIIFTAITLGVIITAFAKFSDYRNIKKHFSFSYNNFSANMLFSATLGAMFVLPLKFFSLVFLVLLCYYFIKYALTEKSFLFLLLSVVYGYIGLTYIIFSTIINASNELSFLFGMFYIVVSCVGVVLFFIFHKKILGIKK